MTNFSNTSIIELAAIICNQLAENGIEVVLVGGLAVEFYSKNIYLTKDIDFVNINYQQSNKLSKSLSELGFFKNGRVYENKTTQITVEFPAAPLSVGDESITETTSVHVNGINIPILYAIDVVKDRLSAFFHWNDRPALAQP